jgi:CelD/BcsL family acetyltransferase involved in cellulose biosynthesis
MLTHTRTKPKELPRRKAPGPLRARGGDELAPLEARWPAANDYPASPAPSFAWLSAARIAFSEAAELRVLTAERDGRTLAATALAASGHGLSWHWMPLGSELGEPTDLSGEDPRALRCLARSLIRLGQPVVLERMPADSPALAAIRRAARGHAVIFKQAAEPELGLQLDEGWVRPERHLSPSERRPFARARREAERLGGVSTEIHTPDLFELPGLLDQAFQCEGPVRGADEETLARRMSSVVFFRHYCEAACVAGLLRIGLVRIADRVAAAAIAVEQGSTIWLLRIAVNPRYATCQPGQLIVREMLSYGAEAGLRRCELWGERHSWLNAWPIAQRPCVRLSIYPLTIAGATAAAAKGAAGLARRVVRRVRVN